MKSLSNQLGPSISILAKPSQSETLIRMHIYVKITLIFRGYFNEQRQHFRQNELIRSGVFGLFALPKTNHQAMLQA